MYAVTDLAVIFCSLYRFSDTNAERIVVSVEGPQPERLPGIGTYPELVEILKRELGYCACAPDEVFGVLCGFLQAARERTEATADSEAFSRASRTPGAGLSLDAAPGIASWFVYGLQQRSLIWHGFRVIDSWTTDKGRRLLEAVEASFRRPIPRSERPFGYHPAVTRKGKRPCERADRSDRRGEPRRPGSSGNAARRERRASL